MPRGIKTTPSQDNSNRLTAEEYAVLKSIASNIITLGLQDAETMTPREAHKFWNMVKDQAVTQAVKSWNEITQPKLINA